MGWAGRPRPGTETAPGRGGMGSAETEVEFGFSLRLFGEIIVLKEVVFFEVRVRGVIVEGFDIGRLVDPVRGVGFLGVVDASETVSVIKA